MTHLDLILRFRMGGFWYRARWSHNATPEDILKCADHARELVGQHGSQGYLIEETTLEATSNRVAGRCIDYRAI